jgi:hypothetical protein
MREGRAESMFSWTVADITQLIVAITGLVTAISGMIAVISRIRQPRRHRDDGRCVALFAAERVDQRVRE